MSLKRMISMVALILSAGACSAANNLSRSAVSYDPANSPVTCTYNANSKECVKRTKEYTLYARRENDICEAGIFMHRRDPSAAYSNLYDDYLKLKDVLCDGRVDTATEGRKKVDDTLVWPTAYQHTRQRSEDPGWFEKEADKLFKKINDEIMEPTKQ